MELDKLSTIKSIEELLILAQNLERQAILNYERLAEEMRAHYNLETALLFERLAEEESSHESALNQMTKEPALEETSSQLWVFPIEIKLTDALKDPFLFSPYDALCYALYNEGKTFELFTHLAAISRNASIKKMAEDFAKEELSHMVALRLARREVSKQARENCEKLGVLNQHKPIEGTTELDIIFNRLDHDIFTKFKNTSQQLLIYGDKDNSHFFEEISLLVQGNGQDHSKIILTSSSNEPVTDQLPQLIIIDALRHTDQVIDYLTHISEETEIDDIYQKTIKKIETYSQYLHSIRGALSTFLPKTETA